MLIPLLLIPLLLGCDGGGAEFVRTDTDLTSGDTEEETCDPIESGEGRVVIGFWENDDCSGEPMITNSFPIESDASCYCWPGHSGENSAQHFSCNDGDGSFTYDQYGSLDCEVSDSSATTKTSYTDSCEQDIPPTLYSKIIDYSACE